MRRSTFFVFMAMVAVGTPLCVQAQAPREIAGFILGDQIETCEAHLQMETAIPIRYQPYLREVQIKSMGGFKTGLITFENCVQPGRIVRIKMKYADGSKAFYQQLLKRYKARFGDDPEWRGDPFHISLAWKWSFADDQGNRISMTLQHNLKDREQKRGNAVKLTLHSALEEARGCFESGRARAKVPPQRMDPIDWNRLIPR